MIVTFLPKIHLGSFPIASSFAGHKKVLLNANFNFLACRFLLRKQYSSHISSFASSQMSSVMPSFHAFSYALTPVCKAFFLYSPQNPAVQFGKFLFLCQSMVCSSTIFSLKPPLTFLNIVNFCPLNI